MGGKPTFAEAIENEEDAPNSDLPAVALEKGTSFQSCLSLCARRIPRETGSSACALLGSFVWLIIE